MESITSSVEGVEGVHDVRAEYIGPDTVHVGMHIEVKRGMPVEEADRIAEEVHKRVHQSISGRHCIIYVGAAGG